MSIKWCIVCSGNYDNGIQNLAGCNNSTAWLHSVIMTKLGVPEEDILYIVDKKREDVISLILKFLERLKEDDTIIFYFCGHGIKANDDLCLFTRDTHKEFIQITSINYRQIIDIFKQQKAKKIIAILDCCYSGTAVNMGLEEKEDSKVVVEGEVTLCSCSQVEKSIQDEIEGKYHCVFTYTFTEVLLLGSKLDKEFLSIADIMTILKEKYEERTDKTLTIGRKQDLDKMNIFKNMNYVKRKKEEKKHELEEIRNKMVRKKQWKVLLVKTAIEHPTRGNDFGVPLGLWVLKNYITLLMPNVVVDIYDERLLEMQSTVKVFEEEIKEYDIIGISVCTCEVPKAIEKFEIAHKIGKITVAGGIFTYSNEKYLLSKKSIDYVIPGVGTLPWVNLIKALIANEEKTDRLVNINYVFSHNNKDTMVWLPDVMPGIELGLWEEVINYYGSFISKKIRIEGKEIEVPKIDIVTSRGCNKSCSFCSVRTETGGSVIRRDIQMIQNEIDYLYSKGIRYFSIKDEDFFIHGDTRVNDIMEYFKRYKDIKFKIRMRIDAWDKYGDKINIQKLKDWKIDEIQYGVESPQNDILMMLQKGINIEKNKVINLFKEHYENEIKVNASFILGCSELENSEYYKKLREFINRIANKEYLIPYLNFFTPHPTHSNLNRDKYTITTNNLNYYTHKIPVAYPSTMLQPAREAMLNIYDEISRETESILYNPVIPDEPSKLFSRGKKCVQQMK